MYSQPDLKKDTQREYPIYVSLKNLPEKKKWKLSFD